MSIVTSKAGDSIPRGILSKGNKNKPYDDISDTNESDTEWWDEEESVPSAPKASQVIQWTRPHDNAGAGNASKPTNRTSTRKADKRYSVQKPTRDKSKGRQRKQNAKAGIKVVTNFSKPQGIVVAAQPVQSQPSRIMPPTGCFVDLAALQALENGPAQATGGFWKSKKNKELTRPADTIPSISKNTQGTSMSGAMNEIVSSGKTKPKGLIPAPLNLDDDLSPSDRPIVIGISIPSARLAEHALSPQTAVLDTSKTLESYEHRTPTGHSPETPTIIITPAGQGSAWSPLERGENSNGYSPSIYSQPPRNVMGIYASNNAPPVPRMPVSVLETERQRIATQRSYFSPDSEEGTTWEDGETTEQGGSSRSRIVSGCTVFEEDESPIIARTGRARSISAASKNFKHASVSTIGTRHRSKGWWNYIVTPFLTRSNTVTTEGVFEDQHPPALPSLAIAAAKAQEAERDRKSWAKQFSPLTPETSTTIHSELWWDTSAKEDESKHPERVPLSSVVGETRHQPQPSSGTLPFVLSNVADFGSATMSSLATENNGHQVDRSISEIGENGTLPTLAVNDGAPVISNASSARVPQNNNPFLQNNPNSAFTSTQPPIRETTLPIPAAQTSVEPSPPPPPYSPSPARPRYRAILPPGNNTQHSNTENLQYPVSPGPVSPGLQQAMASRGGIPMSNVPTPPAVASASRRPVNLNSGYPELPLRQPLTSFTPEDIQQSFPPPPKKARKAEAKRQRHEKEDALARKAGGLWRGRGCISKRGCYGRSGPEGRKKRRLYFALVAGFLSMMILAIVLATTLHRKSNTMTEPSQWLNLTGFPPIYTGLSTVAAPVNTVVDTGCVVPATQWSCDLPKEEQSSVAPNSPSRPNFLLQIQWDNSSSANVTFANVTGNPNLVTRSLVGNSVSAGQFIKHLLLRARQIVTFVPNPAPPSFAEEFFLGDTTDGIVSANKAGEPTPFYISFLSPTGSTVEKREIQMRQTVDNSSDQFPNVTNFIPAPSLNSDGTAAPANLLPLPSQQPIRLFDRGLPSEHYGFYSYFDRSIFLKSITQLNDSNSNDEVPDDENGGATKSEAAFRCTWSQTRFLVQMWTRANTTAQLLNGTASGTSSPGIDFTQPGSFPYPVTITTDRHGGDPALKMLYCYTMNEVEGLIPTSGHINQEARGFGGTVINPAPAAFLNVSDPSQGGFDGGTGGCSCQWKNFQNVISA